MAKAEYRSVSEAGNKTERKDVDDRAGEGRITSGYQDPLVVPTSALKEVLDEFVETWKRERPTDSISADEAVGMYGDGVRKQKTRAHFMGPIRYLAEEAGTSERQINRVLRGELSCISFNLAERILIAIDCEYMLRWPELRPVQNPLWSAERYEAWLRAVQAGCSD